VPACRKVLGLGNGRRIGFKKRRVKSSHQGFFTLLFSSLIPNFSKANIAICRRKEYNTAIARPKRQNEEEHT